MAKIRIGVVGLNFGRHIVEEEIVQGPGSPYFELAGVCDLDGAKAGALAAKHGVTAYPDLDTLLADSEVPVVGLFTGPVGRAELVQRIVRAGKDVMTTKPFELDAAAALTALQEARQLGRAVHLNSPAPLLPADLRQIKQWHQEHALGRPVAARCETWGHYREQADGSWYDDPDRCPVAPIFRLGIYLINDAVRLLGQPESVQVFASRLFTGRPTADNAELAIRFVGGAVASVFASFCVNDGVYYANTLAIHYENGSVYCNTSPPGGVDSDSVSLQLAVRGPDGAAVIDSAAVARADRSGAYQWGALYRAVRGEMLPDEVTPEEIVAGIRVIDAMARAQDSERTETV